jgi:hypothetical protein
VRRVAALVAAAVLAAGCGRGSSQPSGEERGLAEARLACESLLGGSKDLYAAFDHASAAAAADRRWDALQRAVASLRLIKSLLDEERSAYRQQRIASAQSQRFLDAVGTIDAECAKVAASG